MVNKNIKKKAAYLLILIIVFAAIFYSLNLTSDLGVSPDSANYVILAKSLAMHGKYSQINYPNHPPETHFPPLFPLILSLFYYFFQDNFLIFKIITTFFTLASFYAFFYLLKQYTTTKKSLLITFLFSINTIILMNSTWILTELLYLLLAILTLFFVKRFENKENKIAYLIIPVFIAASMLTRPVGLTLILSIFIYYIFKKKFIRAFLIVLISYVMQLPWVIRNYFLERTSPLIKTDLTHRNIYLLKDYLHPYKGYVTLSSFLNRTLHNIISYIRIHLPSIFYPVFHAIEELGYSDNIYIFSLQVVFGVIIFLLVLHGFLLRLFKKLDIIEVYVIINILILIVYTSPLIRLFIPIMPFLIWYFFDGLKNILNKIFTISVSRSSSRALNINPKKIILFLVIISIVITNITANIFWINMQPYSSDKFDSFFEANNWIDNNTPADSIIIGRKSPLIYFYSNRSAYTYPHTVNKTEMMHTIYELNTDYLIIDPFEEVTHIYLTPLIQEFKSNFTLVYTTEKLPHSYVYKIN